MRPLSNTRILLVTDARLSSDDTGVGRTLVNLLARADPEKLMVLHPIESSPPPELRGLSCKYRTFRTRYFTLPANRLGLVLRTLWGSIHCMIQTVRSKARTDAVSELSPTVLLLCANTLPSLLEGWLVAQANPKCRTVVYVMDDWIGLEDISYVGLNVRQMLVKMMKHACGWIGVSDALLDQIATRYGIPSVPRLLLHNAPPLPPSTPPAYAPTGNRPFRIIYAGSIWGMHLDSLQAVGQAVAILRTRGVAIELVIHTSEQFWGEHQEELSLSGTTYGGQIQYESLPTALSCGDLLLVCSSFLETNRLLANGSLQTKTTDYMVTRRAVLAVGPAESASNRFIEQWKCGICVATNDPQCIASSIERIVHSPQALIALADAGYEAVKEHFSQNSVFSRFHSFLSNEGEAS